MTILLSTSGDAATIQARQLSRAASDWANTVITQYTEQNLNFSHRECKHCHDRQLMKCDGCHGCDNSVEDSIYIDTHTLVSQFDRSACSSALAADSFSEKASSSFSLSFLLPISRSRCWWDFCSWVNPSRREMNFARSLEGGRHQFLEPYYTISVSILFLTTSCDHDV